MTGHEVIAKLKATGWVVDRVAGSHHVLAKDGLAVPVPVHGKRDGSITHSSRTGGVGAAEDGRST